MLISIMKIFITLLLLFNITFASKAIEYNQLDNELNKISTKLSLEDKVYLYSLILSTENKIKTIVSTKEKNIESLKKLNSKTILFLKELKLGKDIKTDNLEKAYKSLNVKVIKKLKTPIIVEKTKTFDYNYFVIFTIGLIIGLISWKFLSKKEIKEIVVEKIIKVKSDDDEQLKQEIQHLNEYVESLQNALAKYESS